MASFARFVSSALAVGGEVPADTSGDPRRGVLDGVPGKVRVPGCRLHLCVTEQLPDHCEALAQGQGPRRIRVSDVMEAHVAESGPRSDGLPGPVQSSQRAARAGVVCAPAILSVSARVRHGLQMAPRGGVYLGGI